MNTRDLVGGRLQALNLVTQVKSSILTSHSIHLGIAHTKRTAPFVLLEGGEH